MPQLKKALTYTLLSSCALLMGCNNGSNSTSQENPMSYSTQEKEEILPLKLMHEGQNSPMNNNGPEVVLLNDQQKFNDFWSQHVKDKPAPNVDFKRFEIIAVVDESQATGGYTMSVTQVAKRSDEVLVRAVRLRPGANCMDTLVITKPYSIVMVPHFDKPVALSLSMSVQDCKAK